MCQFPIVFWRAVTPPLISAQRDSWQDGGSPPEDLRVLAGLPSPSRGSCCPPEHVLPARFLPVVAENASCGARHGPFRMGRPLGCIRQMGRVFEVHGKIQNKVCWQSSSSSSSKSFTRTSLHAFLDSFTHVRKGVPLLPRGPGASVSPWAPALPRPLPSVSQTLTSRVGLNVGLGHDPICPPISRASLSFSGRPGMCEQTLVSLGPGPSDPSLLLPWDGCRQSKHLPSPFSLGCPHPSPHM